MLGLDRTALHLAVANGNYSTVHLLMEPRRRGDVCDINACDTEGRTPLYEAAVRRFPRIAKVRAEQHTERASYHDTTAIIDSQVDITNMRAAG